MMKFGVKIVDKSCMENEDRMANWIPYLKSLEGNELALYNDTDLLPEGLSYNNIHTNHGKLNIAEFFNNRESVHIYMEELRFSCFHYGIKKAVVHVFHLNLINDYTEDQLREFLMYLDSFSKETGIKFFIENIALSTDDLRYIFSVLKQNDFGFCFDIGHAKINVFNEDIHQWLKFIEEFDNSIHVHYHSNKGTPIPVEDRVEKYKEAFKGDLHLPITPITMHWNQEEDFHKGLDYFDIACRIINIKGEDSGSSFITETYFHFIEVNKRFLNRLTAYSLKYTKISNF